jgi:cytochrome c1
LTVLTVAAYCAPQPLNPTEPAGERDGKQLIVLKGCGGCHTVPGVVGATGEAGPYLGGVASRPRIASGAVPNNGPDDLERWIVDPPALKPSTMMPKLGLSSAEAAAIVSYLESLP